ncbi:hypothetical protein [Aureimonas phyllosphaerae]|uniref:Uncharacterized protein n=1 Tax=Aureimonas phyllosphaerae TaxID=1166078 RepID=A0A7W6C0R8_9HYPH|nr:hypothetical protein [Aureimonas phyllosphaerae]MBB3937286.1 hypothetical protein [Aureimonas phyllosphaerae]
MSRRTTVLLLIALGLAVLHHIDHALRVDHSGWPFRERVTPFTYSLTAYPIVLFALMGPVRAFWLRWALIATATAFTIYAHTAIESPGTQFHMWVHNRSVHDANLHNALNIRSVGMGAVSVAVGMALNLTVVLATLSMLRDGLSAIRRDR